VTLANPKKPNSWKYTREQAWDRFACARCGRPVHPASHPPDGDHIGNWADRDRDEYWISGICPSCWVAVMGPEDA